MEYCLTDLWMGQASAELGTLVRSHASRSRRLRCDVRVGSHELDNTNFRGGPGGSGGAGDAPLPLDFDYDVIRQSLWWAADRTYKSAVETLEAKKAFMEGKVIEDKPNDFSRESPVVFLEDRIELAGEPQDLETLVLDASSVFRGFPEVQDSSVSVQSGRGHKYLVNNEGTRIRTAHVWWWISAAATVQAEDGMSISDSLTYYVRRKEDLPTSEELRNEARAMAARLIAVRTAPKLEHYSGPVLFDAPAAAGLFARTFALRLPGGQRPVGSRASPDDFANKIGKRVLPRFLNIVDDPTREEIEGTTVIGRYRYDDQGVPAAPTTLVEKGRLVAQLMSRNPSREFPRSTGHGRGVLAPWPSIGCLIVSS